MRHCAALLACAIIAALLAGCSQKTPEERFQKAVSLLQQRDSLGAMLEAKDLIKKYPTDPFAMQAHMLLAEVNMIDQRPDDAIAEYRIVLDGLPQSDDMGRIALRNLIGVLRDGKRYDEALTLIDEYKKKNAKDEGVSLSLTVASVEVMTAAGQTTGARTVIESLQVGTTEPQVLSLYRNLKAQTFFRDQDYAAARDYFKGELGSANTGTDKRFLTLQVAAIEAAKGDYPAARQWLGDATALYDAAIRDELDANRKLQLSMELASAYSSIGNLKGAVPIFEAALVEARDPMVAGRVVQQLGMTLQRQGRTSDVVTLLRRMGEKFPESPWAGEAARIEAANAQGALAKQMPPDTSPLVLKFAADELIVPKTVLERKADAPTSGPVAASAPATTATADKK